MEGLVAQHLLAWNDYSGNHHKIEYWRTRSGIEVDFVIYGPKGFWAIEVKNAKREFLQKAKYWTKHSLQNMKRLSHLIAS